MGSQAEDSSGSRETALKMSVDTPFEIKELHADLFTEGIEQHVQALIQRVIARAQHIEAMVANAHSVSPELRREAIAINAALFDLKDRMDDVILRLEAADVRAQFQKNVLDRIAALDRDHEGEFDWSQVLADPYIYPAEDPDVHEALRIRLDTLVDEADEIIPQMRGHEQGIEIQADRVAAQIKDLLERPELTDDAHQLLVPILRELEGEQVPISSASVRVEPDRSQNHVSAEAHDAHQWARTHGVGNMETAQLINLKERFEKLKQIIDGDHEATNLYLRDEKLDSLRKMDEDQFEHFCKQVRRQVQLRNGSFSFYKSLESYPEGYEGEDESDTPTLIPFSEADTPTLVPIPEQVESEPDEVITQHGVSHPAYLKEAVQTQAEYDQSASKRRRDVVGKFLAKVAGIALAVFGASQVIESPRAHMERSFTEAVASAQVNQAPQVLPDVSLEEITESTTSELAARIVENRYSELTTLEKSRVAAASTNAAVLALNEDIAPHVNPDLPAELVILELEKWGGYRAPIESFKTSLLVDGTSLESADAGDLLDYVGSHSEVGGATTANLIDRMLGTVPSFALDPELTHTAMMASNGFILTGDVDAEAVAKVAELKAKGAYNLDSTPKQATNGSASYDPTDAPDSPLLGQSPLVENSIPDLSADLELEYDPSFQFAGDPTEVPEPHFVKPVLKESIPDVTNDLEGDDDIPDVTAELILEEVLPVKTSWLARARQKVSSWFS